MNTVRHILQVKGFDLWTVTPDITVFDGLRIMADKDIGALLVVEHDKLLGIFTERHYARKIVLLGKTSQKTPIRDVMSTTLVPIHPDQTVEEALALMSEKKVHYLPVMEGDHLLGILSIGDAVTSIIFHQLVTIRSLEVKAHWP